MSLVPLGALAALGGAYPSATLPILVAATAVFVLSRARVCEGDARALDLGLLALVAGVVIQVMPLPAALVGSLSPHLQALRDGLYLDGAAAATTLSADPRLTRAGLASLVSAVLVFWAAREVFSRGGVRAAARAVAWAGFALALVAFVQRATAPDLLLWTWKPVDPGSQPFGPFVNRNHLGTWLLMGGSLTAGYLVSHTRSLGASQLSLRLRVRDWLADGNGLVLAAALLLMLAALVATLSRSAILAAGVALVVGSGASRAEDRGRTLRVAGVALMVLLAAAVWSKREGLARKFDAATTASRVMIWRETLPVVRDFWATGTGVGTYGPAMLRYQEHEREVHLNQAHSEYLQVAAEGGLLLCAPLAVVVLAGFGLARRRLKDDARPIAWLRIGAAAGLAAVSVQGIFETGLRIPANGLLAAILAAILLYDPQER